MRNIVKAFPRDSFYRVPRKKRDPRIIEEYKKHLTFLFKTDYPTRHIKNKKREGEIKRELRAKALSKAIEIIKKQDKMAKLKEAQEAAATEARAQRKLLKEAAQAESEQQTQEVTQEQKPSS